MPRNVQHGQRRPRPGSVVPLLVLLGILLGVLAVELVIMFGGS